MEKRSDCCLVFFRFINILTTLSAILCLVAFSLAIVEGPPFTDTLHMKAQLLRYLAAAMSPMVDSKQCVVKRSNVTIVTSVLVMEFPEATLGLPWQSVWSPLGGGPCNHRNGV